MSLQPYNLDIQYINCTENVITDVLSFVLHAASMLFPSANLSVLHPLHCSFGIEVAGVVG